MPLLAKTTTIQTLGYLAAAPVPQDTPTTADGAHVQHPPTPAAPTAQASDPDDMRATVAGHADDDQYTVPEQATAAEDFVAVAAASDEPTGPSFVRPTVRPTSARIPRWHWIALTALTGALVIQMLVADRTRLAQDASWRPLLERVCGALRCTLPAWQQPQAYTMLARDVKLVPDAAGVLQVRATFRNDARWPQPWPAVALSLSDADGRVAGARVMVPADYLEPAQLHATLAPGQSGQMTVQIREPRDGVVAFAFEFR